LPASGGARGGDREADDGALPSHLRHDLINALNALLGFAALLEADLPTGQSRDFASRILMAGREAMRLAESLPSSRKNNVRVLAVTARGARADGLFVALESFGCDITEVQGAADAAEALRRAPKAWDVVLADAAIVDHAGLPETVKALNVRLLVRDPDAKAHALALALRGEGQ
jgi:signal transduction histidine kinase